MSDRIANFVDSREITAYLIASPLSWRVRVVEELTVDSATSCLRKRSLQVAPLRPVLDPLMGPIDPDIDQALVAINVAPVPRGPLLEFDVDGPIEQGFLLPRMEIAERQSLYLQNLSLELGASPSEDLQRLLTGIMGFVGGAELDTADEASVAAFISDGLGQAPDPDAFASWREVDATCQQILRPRADLIGPHSAPETPSVLVPYLKANGVDDVTATLNEYAALLEQMADGASAVAPTTADDFLNSLADYGNHYDLIIATKVPLDEPFLIKYTERRSLALSRFRNEASQDLVVADALTNHVTISRT